MPQHSLMLNWYGCRRKFHRSSRIGNLACGFRNSDINGLLLVMT